jgi:hypothetical protein
MALIPTVFVELPKCPACGSLDLKTIRSKTHSPTAVSRTTDCQGCGLRFMVCASSDSQEPPLSMPAIAQLHGMSFDETLRAFRWLKLKPDDAAAVDKIGEWKAARLDGSTPALTPFAMIQAGWARARAERAAGRI